MRDKHWRFLIFNRGVSVQLVGAIVLGAVEGIWDSNAGGRHRGSRGEWVAMMCIYLIYLGVWLLIRGRRMQMFGFESMFAATSDLPVLYLRPFRTAGFKMFGSGPFIPGVRALLTMPEERLLNRLWRFGAVTTAARPGEQLPFPGAIHLHISESDWHTQVLESIRRAGLVAIRLSNTKNLMWEIECAARIKERSTLLFWYPPSDTWGDSMEVNSWEELRPLLESLLGAPLPSKVWRGSYLYFDQDGRVFSSYRLAPFLVQRAKTRTRSLLEIARKIQIFLALLGLVVGWWLGHTITSSLFHGVHMSG